MSDKNLLMVLMLYTSISLLVSIYVYYSHLSSPVRDGLLLAVISSACNSFLSFIAVRWAYFRSNKIFFSALYGSMAWKLAALLGLALFLLHNAQFHMTATLVGTAFFSFAFSMMGLKFLTALRPAKNYGF